MTCSHEIKRHLLLGRKVMANVESIFKSRNITLLTKVHITKLWFFPVVTLDHKEGWVLENWCFQIVVLENTLESPLNCEDIKSISPKGNQPWIFIGRTDAESTLATWCKKPNHWKRSWCWERLKAKGGGDRDWYG